MRFGIIGCGSIAASSFAPSLLKSRETDLTAVCRRDGDGAREFARRFGGCAAYDSAAALIADAAVEAVIVSTPTDTHCEHTLAAAAAGKHVLCEKPMARDRREARRMMEACRDAGVTLGIAYRRRLFPQVLEAKRRLAAGEIGRQVFSRTHYSGGGGLGSGSWQTQPGIGGALMEMAVHRIEVLLNLAGSEPVEVCGLLDTVHHDWPVDDTDALLLRFADGTAGDALDDPHLQPAPGLRPGRRRRRPHRHRRPGARRRGDRGGDRLGTRVGTRRAAAGPVLRSAHDRGLRERRAGGARAGLRRGHRVPGAGRGRRGEGVLRQRRPRHRGALGLKEAIPMTERPNILFILTDDQGPWALCCAGNDEIRTPGLDRIAATGVRFEHFLCASPVCSPSRASFLTGRMPSQHGVHDWIREGNVGDDAALYLEGETACTDVLAAHGYKVGLSGKWHLGHSQLVQHGFSHWYVHQRGGGDYNRPPMIRDGQLVTEDGYVTNLITDDALAFLDAHAGGPEPFYLGVHYTAPHSPWTGHPRDIVDSYDDCPFDTCPQEPIHEWARGHGLSEGCLGNREMLKGYFAAVTAMDADVVRLLDRLQTLGLRERTLVVFASDNGFSCGHHGFWGKGNGTFP